MSNEITIITPKSLIEVRDLADQLSGAKTIQDALQKSPADVLAIIMTGAELGLAPMQSLRALVLIKGKPALSADAMVALVKARKDRCKSFRMVESTPLKATYKTVEVDGDEAGTTLSFTMADAQAAGIAGDMYRRYPAQMLRARCKAALCREVYPDLMLGVYDPDELSPERDITTPRASPPTHIVDVTPSALPAPVDHDPSGAPVSERAKLEVALNEAQEVAGLNALVDRLGRLKGSDVEAYTRLRARWGVRRNELMAAAKVDAAVQAVDVTRFAPPVTNGVHPEPGSEG